MKQLTIALVAFCLAVRAEAQEANAVADRALIPAPLNTKPGPEYQSAARLYQGVPGIARDEKSGRLWATWFTGGRDESKENYVLVVTSHDDGATWTEPVLVVDPQQNVRTFDPCLWTTPDGRLLLFYAQNEATERLHDGRWGVWYTTCEHPDRADSSWTPPQRICDGIMLNKPTVLRNGAWLLPVAHWYDRAHGAGVVQSLDEGKSFTKIGGAPGRNAVSADGVGGGMEHILIERRDGSLWMPMRIGDGLAESISTDGGVTWSQPVRSAMPGPAARFHVRRLKSGRLLMVNYVGFSPDAWPPANRRSHLTAMLSDDDGKTWPHRLLLDDRLQVSYPDVVETSAGKLYIIYDRGRTSHREILLAITTQADILSGQAGPATKLRLLINKATGPR